jgi:hypothetical protein
MSYRNDPVHWRNRARSMRMRVEETDNVHAKAMMLKLADDYDRRGEEAEARIGGGPSMKLLPARVSGGPFTQLPPVDLSEHRRRRMRRDA